MEMWTGGSAGRADPADDLSDLDVLPDADVDLGQMSVARRETIAVVDLDHLAVTALPAGVAYRAGGGGFHRIAAVAAKIEPGMHRGSPEERVDAHAVARTLIELAGQRLADRHALHGAVEAFDMRARDADALQPLLECRAVRQGTHRHEGSAGAAGFDRRRFAGIDPKLAQHAAHAFGFGIETVFDCCQRHRLACFDTLDRIPAAAQAFRSARPMARGR